jgi:hypothetical protein
VKIEIKKIGNRFCADPIDRPGSPQCGWGSTMDAALGDFLRAYQDQLGVVIEIDETAQKAETERRRKALSSR